MRIGNRVRAIIAALLISCCLAIPSGAADWAGKFKSDTVSLELTPSNDGYTGTLQVGGRSYPVQAKEGADGALVGSFPVGTTTYEFRATRNGDAISLKS